MIHIAIKIVSIAAALLLVARFIPGISIDSLTAAFIAALILGALNVSVKPLLAILTFPITLLTFGLFSFVLNAAMFGLAAYIVPGFAVAGFIPALLGSFIVTVVSTLAYRILT
jgi:putative membrane protein